MNETNQNKLNNDITIIVNEVLEITICAVKAIILYGSYGRGEGAFYSDENGNIHTYNDYDLILVVDDFIESIKINQIAHSLEEKLDVKWIDISQKKKSKLKNLKLTIFNYDLKYGSRVIYGDKEILDNVPKFKSSKISLKEAETLYFTRLYTFIGSITENNFVIGVKDENARFFRNQMAKAILAVVDSLLLIKGEYHYSYKKRGSLIQQFYPDKKDLIKMAKWALSEKLNPKDKSMKGEDTLDFYTKVLKIYKKEMFYVLSKFYGRDIISTRDIEIRRYLSIQEFILRIKTLIKSRSFNCYQKSFQIEMAQSYFVEAFLLEDKERSLFLRKSVRIVKKINPNITFDLNNWDNLRKVIADLRQKTK